MEGEIEAIQMEHLGRISFMWQWDMQCHSLFEWVKNNYARHIVLQYGIYSEDLKYLVESGK